MLIGKKIYFLICAGLVLVVTITVFSKWDSNSPQNNETTVSEEDNLITTSEDVIKYPLNERGQTYGNGPFPSGSDHEPDLIAATGVDGTNGYVLKKDLEGEQPKTPEEALAIQRDNSPNGRDIPLYDVDGITVIGVFHKGGK